jgi:hypothetical protein
MISDIDNITNELSKITTSNIDNITIELSKITTSNIDNITNELSKITRVKKIVFDRVFYWYCLFAPYYFLLPQKVTRYYIF